MIYLTVACQTYFPEVNIYLDKILFLLTRLKIFGHRRLRRTLVHSEFYSSISIQGNKPKMALF